MTEKFVFHILGMSFTATSQRYLGDAHTQNIFNVCKMLTRTGHTVFHYGNHGSDVPCTEHIDLLGRDEIDALYAGDDLKRAATGYFIKDTPQVRRSFTRRAVDAIARRKRAGDFLLGLREPHDEIALMHNDMTYVHHSVGYVGWNPRLTVYASEFIRNFNLSKEHTRTGNPVVGPWSAVIPHFLDPEEFVPCYDADDYFLYIGRLAPEKGVQMAIDVCTHLGAKLLIAGQGQIDQFQLSGSVDYVGFIEDMVKRNELIRKARAVFVPTHVPEPFGMVVIEALMSGVPVISSDWGSLPEINEHGVTGYRCATFSDYVCAASQIRNISRETCRRVAEKRFSVSVASRLYQNYFERVRDLHEHGERSTRRAYIDLNFITH